MIAPNTGDRSFPPDTRRMTLLVRSGLLGWMPDVQHGSEEMKKLHHRL
jgi:hypothetical protein